MEHKESKLESYIELSYTEASDDKFKGEEYLHAAHAMIYADDDITIFDIYTQKASVMMQMRFDGDMGFPGGFIDRGETPEEGLNRELNEEIGLDLSKHQVSRSDWVQSYLDPDKKLVLHFYILKVTVEEFTVIERKTLEADHYGIEVFGPIRVPLFMDTKSDGPRGLPCFLANQFAGNARDELLCALMKEKILSKEYVESALERSKKHLSRPAK